MSETATYDLVVIGGGPGGYVAAIRAAQLGMKVACVERDRLGGVCLNWGCIPTKALIAGAEFYHRLTHEAEEWGVKAEGVTHDWGRVIERSREVAGQLNKGVGFLLKKNKVTHIEGHAFIPSAGKVEIYASDDSERQGSVKQVLEAGKILIATGARPRPLPGAEFDGKRIIGAKEAMTLTEQPKSMVIVGAGAIGMEFAYVYNAYGTRCTVVEMMDRVLPIEDTEASDVVERAFGKMGVTVKTGHKTLSLEKTDEGVRATVAPADDESKTEVLEADVVLVAIGVMGRYDGLFDASLGVETFKDHIKVDYRSAGADYQTSVPGIYAIGDVIGPPWLAHVSSEEGIVCVERMAGHEVEDIDYDAIPGCTYCQPQVASVGLTERACEEQGIEYVASKFPFAASGKAQALGATEGFCKLISGKKHGEVLGAHMVGEGVTELIAEIGLAIKLEATMDEVIGTMHAHPTLSEATHEAALGAQNRMIHF
ncbi:dihydrolipoyl dehydrogenase [Mucisphaera calidilacus]|uniref:Dihydrolipoyl dehydrogenase n=1 Tax=Mucisphaera calidilacus TaxID=2527982 RepID=A0A518BYF6_9BACT|nr:dihydrolipoyl dehydrogenase [Mucisphaera calidilacus]QDU71996.1 Dihydrolipoyl dehydrogenase [Mucisphaera calidilacus]